MGNFWVSLLVVVGLMAPVAVSAAGKSSSCNVSAVEISLQDLLEIENSLKTSRFLNQAGRTSKEVWIKAQGLALNFGFKDLSEFSLLLAEKMNDHLQELSLLNDLMSVSLAFEKDYGFTKYALVSSPQNLAKTQILADRAEFDEKLKAIEKEEKEHLYILKKEEPSPLNKSSIKKFGELFEKAINEFLSELSVELRNLDMSMQDILLKMETDELLAYEISEKIVISAYFNSLALSNFVVPRETWQELQFWLKSMKTDESQAFAKQFVLLTKADRVEELTVDYVERPSMTVRFHDASDQYDRDGHLFMREMRFADDRRYRTIEVDGVVIPTLAPGRSRKMLAEEAYDTSYKTESFWGKEDAEEFFQWLQGKHSILQNESNLKDYIQTLSTDAQAIKKLEAIVADVDKYMLKNFRIEAVYDPEVGLVTASSKRKLPESYYSFSFHPFIEMAIYMRKDSEYIAENVIPILDSLLELQKIMDWERYDFPYILSKELTN